MLQLALYQPEIPPNTGNIIRLCANTNTQLHLIHPLGFCLDDKRLRRAGLDYHEWANVIQHDSYEAFANAMQNKKILALSTRGQAYYHEHQFSDDDVLLFGPETRGLPQSLLDALPAEQVLKIPMRKDSRSINLSNSAAIVLYEGWRQLGFNFT